MKRIIAILMVIFMSVCLTDIAFAQNTTDDTPVESVMTQTKNKKEKTKKEKKKKEKAKKPKTEIKKDKSTKEKTKKEQPVRVEKVKHRSALSMYLNPNLDIQEVRASHILVKKRKDAVKIRKEILSGNITFEDAAKEYSLCPTGAKGGDLGYFNRKRMEQVFADTAFDLKIGEVSSPVGTKFGWHLIKVYDKR